MQGGSKQGILQESSVLLEDHVSATLVCSAVHRSDVSRGYFGLGGNLILKRAYTTAAVVREGVNLCSWSLKSCVFAFRHDFLHKRPWIAHAEHTRNVPLSLWFRV